MDGKGIDNAVEWSTDIQLAKNIFGRRIGALRFSLLGIHASDLGSGIAIPLFLLKQLKVRFRGGKLILRLLYFAGRSRAVLLQTLQGFEFALRRVALITGLSHLRLKSQNFFAIAPTLHERLSQPAQLALEPMRAPPGCWLRRRPVAPGAAPSLRVALL